MGYFIFQDSWLPKGRNDLGMISVHRVSCIIMYYITKKNYQQIKFGNMVKENAISSVYANSTPKTAFKFVSLLFCK